MPLIVGGYFYIIRKTSECNKDIALNKWSRLSNVVIENWEFKEIEMAGRRYTWSNNREHPTLKKLDKILISL